MLNRILPVLTVIGAIFFLFVWWLFFSDASAPEKAPGVLDIEEWRLLVDDVPTETLPTAVHWLEIGSDMAPSFAVQAGAFHEPVAMSYNALQIATPDGTIIVGGAVDASTAEAMRQDEAVARFDADAYSTLVFALLEAEIVMITHEHLDHIMAIARHPDPNTLAPALYFNSPQINALPRFVTGPMPALFKTLEPRLSGKVEVVAPGVVVVPAAGHTPGAQLIFIKLQNGQEMLLIGDTVWSMSNIVDLTTRPVLTQFVVFDPNEDRSAVKRQLRALHDLSKSEPDLVIIPSHDRKYINRLVADGILIAEFL